MNRPAILVHRVDILNILLSSFLQGGDKSTLLALAVAFDVYEEFEAKVKSSNSQRVIELIKTGEK